MVTRKPRNPELAQAADNLGQAAQHVRNAVRGKIDEVRAGAAAELAKAKAKAQKKTDAAHGRVEAALIKAEAKLHKLIATAQTRLDKAVREAEKRYGAAPAAKKRSTTKKAG